MIVVIIAGGAGSRLWPLSTPEMPKQLLKLTNDKSMLQNTHYRAEILGDEIYVVPVKEIAGQVQQQIEGLDSEHLINEPARRGTANCIVAALAHISKRHDHDEPVAFIHADHHIRDMAGFAKSFRAAGRVSGKTGTITLIGIKPTVPATGFGYIKRAGELDGELGAYHVESFKEKPDFTTARSYVSSGDYLWNCGYFVGSVNTFVRSMEEYAPDLKENFDTLTAIGDQSSDEYVRAYESFTDEVIDIALIEKSKNLAVVPGEFDWMDVGSFSDLHEANETDEIGNHLRGDAIYVDEVENAYLRNEEDSKPLVVIGLNNIVVVSTPNGVLVARKDRSQRVKEAVKRMAKDK
jgi:mannose-1-phosphate guanylyltransferase/mannose-6-phosphate isomerase